MRTTLDIDDDLLTAAKELARHENRSAGQIVSRLLREALTGAKTVAPRTRTRGVAGFVPFPGTPGVVATNEMVNRIRDEEGI